MKLYVVAKEFGVRPCDIARGSASDLDFDLSVIEAGIEAKERARKRSGNIAEAGVKRFF